MKKSILLVIVSVLSVLLLTGCADLTLNEYGFYFDIGYTTKIGNDKLTYVFFEDGGMGIYMNGIMSPESAELIQDIIYRQGEIEIIAKNKSGVLTVSDEGETLTLTQNGETLTFKLDRAFDLSTDSKEKNIYGFYYDRTYSLSKSYMYSDAYVFKPDGRVEVYQGRVLITTLPAGSAQYFEGGYIYIPILDSKNVFKASEDGKTLDYTRSKFYYLDSETTSQVNQYGFYYNASYKDAFGNDEKIFTPEDSGVEYTYEDGKITSYDLSLPNREYYTVMGDGKILLRTNVSYAPPRDGLEVNDSFECHERIDYSGLTLNEYGFCTDVAYTCLQTSSSFKLYADGTAASYQYRTISSQGHWTCENGEIRITLLSINHEYEHILTISKDGFFLTNGAEGLFYYANKATELPDAPRLKYTFSYDRSSYVIYGIEGQTYGGLFLSIPSEIEGIPVTTIRQHAFEGKTISGIIIPDSVAYIQDNAFSGCNLQYVQLGNGLKEIGLAAFSDNALLSITIPAGVEIIQNQVFAGNKDLTDIYCEATVKPDGWFEHWADDYPEEINGEYQSKPLDATIHWGTSPN